MSHRADIWRAVHAERHRLVEDLAGISEDQWQTPSLCRGWSVHDVLAHLIDAATTTRLGFIRQMVSARGNFDSANAAGVKRHRAHEPQQTLQRFRAVIDHTDTPPGALATRLVEAYVHGEDIRRPLGITCDYPPEHVATALRYMCATAAALGGGKERVRNFRLAPTDIDVVIGERAQVQGSAITLLLAASGRPVHATELQGPGALALSRHT